MNVKFDISVFTESEAVGMVSGDIAVPVVPQIGDVVTFDLQSADPVRHEAAAGIGLLKVTDRLIHAGAGGVVTVMLSDITAKTKGEALQIIAFFEDCHGLFGDRWDEQDAEAKAKI